MNLLDYCDALNLVIEVRYYHNQSRRWTAKFEHAEITDGRMLTCATGDGKTPAEAIRSYVLGIEGKRLILNAGSKEFRREYVVPLGLVFAGDEEIS